MKEYIIKYETYEGNVLIKTVIGYDKNSALAALCNCKEVYWCKLSSAVSTAKNLL